MTATKNNSIFKKLGALAMAMCLTCALAVSASAANVSYGVEFLKADGSSSMANNAIAGDAVYDSEANTLTIPIEKSFMMRNHPSTGLLTMFYGCVVGSTVDGTAVGEAEWEADEIVINDFTPNDTNTYSATFTVEVRNFWTGEVTVFEDMTNATATMVLS